MVQHRTTRNACIATALALAALLVAAPSAAADPYVDEDGALVWDDCVFVNPWALPPTWHVHPEKCPLG